jgi:hypothetical protein
MCYSCFVSSIEHILLGNKHGRLITVGFFVHRGTHANAHRLCSTRLETRKNSPLIESKIFDGLTVMISACHWTRSREIGVRYILANLPGVNHLLSNST